ncbi:MAG TPA: hypothetical protein VFY89_11215, partial [Ktedonobacterales bacterium]
ATPNGTTVFALTDTAGAALDGGPTQLSDPTPHFQLWRSDDQGAHWQRTGPLPAPMIYSMRAVNKPGGGQAMIYLQGIDPHAKDPRAGVLGYLYASTDGGQRWTKAPDTDLPPARIGSVGLATVLPDGEVVATNFTADGTTPPWDLYAWKPGERQWRQLTTGLLGIGGVYTVRFIPAGPGGPAALWMFYDMDGQAWESVAAITLAGV